MASWLQLARAVPTYLAKRLVKPKAGYPRVTARVSTDVGGNFSEAISQFMEDFTGVAAKYPFELLDALDAIFMFEPYQAKYLHTTLALGNTGHKLRIGAGTEQRAKEAMSVVNDFAARCFPWSGGSDGAINGLFCQIARTGGLCCEAAPTGSLDDIRRIYLPPVRSIRFRRRPDGTLELCQLQDGRLVPLNPVQTVYHVAVPWDNSPYPMPPVLGAIRAAARLHKFDDSIDGWLHKLSALGVFLAELDPPPQEGNEEQSVYDAKAQTYLNDIATTIRDNLSQGFAAGYSNVRFKFQNTTAGAGGAKDLLQMVLQGLFAGLQRDPIFFGWNWNTTETFAKVVFEELLGGILNFQQGVKRAMEHVLRLQLALQAFGDASISLVFKENRSLDAFMHSEAEQMRAQSVVSQFEAGLIDREEARRLLGHEDQDASAGAFVAAFNRGLGQYEMEPFRRKVWNGYDAGRQLGPQNASMIEVANSAAEARSAARQYVWEIQRELSEAGRIGVRAVYDWALARDIPEEEIFVQEVLRLLIDRSEGSLDAAILEEIARKHLETIWTWARYEDKYTFGPEWDRSARSLGVQFDGVDYTALNYLKRVDRFYVSKFLSGDERVSRQVSDFLREQYLERGLGRGKSIRELRKFEDAFGDLVERIGEHRARVIIDTGVSRAQNWGEMYALHDEEITTFRIAGPWDRLTCAWCNAMRYHEFQVSREIERIEHILSSGDEDISKFAKFITSRFARNEGLKELQRLDSADIQATGMVSAPLHPQCRHRVVAVITLRTGNVYYVEFEAPSLVEGHYSLAA